MKENNAILFWFLITFFCILAQGFYSMLELAAVSFNRVRLQYYVSKGMKRAIWLQYLLEKPSRLFGTVMLGVNVALQFGSQSSREFYASLNLDPDIAPITQVFFVVILGELAPLFAARRYAEHVVLLGIPIVYATERLFSPIIWLIGLLSKMFNRLIGLKDDNLDLALTREELQKVLETKDETEKEEFNFIVSNIFNLRNKNAKDILIPISNVEMISSATSIQQLKNKIITTGKSYLPVYHKSHTNIVAMAFVRDMIRVSNNKQVRDYAKPPWFITQETPLLQILMQFKKNKQNVAVVLNPQGLAIGIITLDRILEEIFETETQENIYESKLDVVIQRTFPGNMPIKEFNSRYSENLPTEEGETFAQLMFIHLGHHPEEGESIFIDRFEITAIETSLMGIKTVSIKSIES